MATLVHVKDSNVLGNQLNLAVNQIRDGLSFLKKYDGQRAEAIAVSAATFGAIFGVDDPAEAQALSDRWNALAAGTYTGLADFINATVRT